MENDLYKYNEVVAPVAVIDEHINRVIIDACKLNGISATLVNQYIPMRYGLRNTFAFRCLLNIHVSPRLTKTAYARLYNNCQQATCHAIDYLNELGLVCELGIPRLIKPFQRYKVDKGYKVTNKGYKVIKDVLALAQII